MLQWLLGGGETPFEPAWREVLAEGVWQYRHLPDDKQRRLHRVTAHLVRRKTWVAGPGFRVTDPMRVVVSGAAALLTLGLDEAYTFPRLKSVILYPAGFDEPEAAPDGSLIGAPDPVFGGGPRLGEAWPRSPIILSWRHAQRQARVPGRGRNLVLHEFAHHVDGLSGDMDGDPHFSTPALARRWAETAEAEFNRLVGRASRREPTLLDIYGATNRAEFFAVATECFFERPHALRAEHADLYALLAECYHQDPTEWLPTPPPKQTPPAKPRHAADRSGRSVGMSADFAAIGLRGVDAIFSRGVLLLNRGDDQQAEQHFTEVIRQTPDDGEAYQHRGAARLGLGDYRGAQSDAETAITLDPDDIDATLTLASACLSLGEDQRVPPLLRRVARETVDHPWAQELEGRLRARANRWREAARAFRRALIGNPHDAALHYWLAECLEHLDDPSAAARRRRRAEQIDPELVRRPPPL